MSSNISRPDIVGSIFIDRAPVEIWNYLTDVSNDAQWRNGIIEAKWVSEPPYSAGSTGLHIVEGVGDWPWKITAFKNAQIMAWEVTGGLFKGSHAAYRIEPDGNGSRFSIEARFKRNIVQTILKFLLRGKFKKDNAADLENLKAIMEG